LAADGSRHAGEAELGGARREQCPDGVAGLGAAGHDVVDQQHRSGAHRLAGQVDAGGRRPALRGAHAAVVRDSARQGERGAAVCGAEAGREFAADVAEAIVPARPGRQRDHQVRPEAREVPRRAVCQQPGKQRVVLARALAFADPLAQLVAWMGELARGEVQTSGRRTHLVAHLQVALLP
jgi:hypothetical protein